MTDIFGLAEADLLPVVSAMAGAPVVRFTVEDRHEVGGYYGLCGDKRAPTFLYETTDGVTGQATAFVKRFTWAGKSEAAHYRHLAAHGVPVPRLYGSFLDGEDCEILFLERLPRVGFESRSEPEWLAMLSVLAKLNAAPPPSGGDARHLHPFEWGGALGGGVWLTGMPQGIDPDALVRALDAVGVPEPERAPMAQKAVVLSDAVAALPVGTLHQDYTGDNLGWRDTPGGPEFVVFDLHKVAIGARFADVACYLGEPDWSPHRDWLGSNGRRDRFLRHYLSEYAAAGGPAVSPEQFRAETALLSWAHKAAVLDWLPTHPANAPHVPELLALLRSPEAREAGGE